MTAPVMTTPAVLVPLGLTRDSSHVYGWNDGTNVRYPIPSVTRAVGLVDKSEPLVGWAKRETAACAVRNLDMLQEMKRTGGPDAAVEWLKRIPDYQRDTAASLGTRVHILAEQIVRGIPAVVAPEEAPYVAAYKAFLTAYRPAFLAVEEMVVSLRYDYAGTFDAIARIDGETWLLDVKTGTGIYPETGLQLAAYGHADFIGKLGTTKRYRIPRPTRYGVIHVRPDGARLVEYHVDRTTFTAFLHARKLLDWTTGQAKTVMGDVLGMKEGAA